LKKQSHSVSKVEQVESKIAAVMQKEAELQSTNRNKRSQNSSVLSPEQSSGPEHSCQRTHSVGRNTPCPCGSRQKYKRCCGKGAPPVLNLAA
jgi:preprotein translocase subunit SecA